MLIVGLSGAIGHGKTSFANFLGDCTDKHQNWETSELITEVAVGLRQYTPRAHPDPDDIAAINQWLGALPEVLLASVHTDIDLSTLLLTPERLQQKPENYQKLFEYLNLMQAQPELQKIDITSTNKQQFRTLLQWLGGYLVKSIDDGIWYDELVRRIKHAQARGLQLATVGGVRFPGDAERLRNAGGSIFVIERDQQQNLDPTDITERERSLIQPDSVIYNDADLQQLAACARQVYHDLSLRQLRPSYKASHKF